MDDIVLIMHTEEPASYLVEQIPGLLLTQVGLESHAQWVLLAVGAPLFSTEQEAWAQQFMRRYGLDAMRFQETHHAAVALLKALGREA